MNRRGHDTRFFIVEGSASEHDESDLLGMMSIGDLARAEYSRLARCGIRIVEGDGQNIDGIARAFSMNDGWDGNDAA